MENVTLLAIDLAKNVFQLHGVNKTGKTIHRKQLKRKDLLSTIANMPPCLIAMESCGGANHWGRQFEKLGHQVKLINPRYVKPFVKRNKNDANDAEAIAIAAQQTEMPSVSIKTLEQQDIQSLHRIRQRLVAQRTALSNQTRGLLGEYGVVMPLGISVLKKNIPLILEDGENELTMMTRELLQELYEELTALEARISKFTKRIELLHATNESCQAISKIPGIGPMTSTIILTTLGDPKHFKNGRHFAAFLGLVPRQYSSGGRTRLLGISKEGNRYVRALLIHGARSVVRCIDKKSDPQSQWLKILVERRGKNKAAVALANKNARVIWSMLAKNEAYRLNG